MKNKKNLIVYFSRADENYSVGYIEKGNTEVIAEYIRDITGGDLFKVEPAIPYSADYDTCIDEAKMRQKTHNAPIINNLPNIVDYEIIYVGSPIYWGEMPEELVTALSNIDFTGKIIRPFTTHEGSGLGNVPNQIKEVCKGATVTEGLAIRGASVYNSKEEVEKWIQKILKK